MKKIYTICLCFLAGSTLAQMPTNFGSNAADGISYQTYNLTDNGVVSSVRFQAQNAVAAGVGNWEFYTGDYMNNWRPYTSDDTLSGFNAVIDPTVETASARYNSNYGGQTGKLPAVQAGYYYTCIIQNGSSDNFMSIIETDFDPVVIDTVYNTPTNPTENDNIVVSVELLNAQTLSAGEHVFIRASTDGYATSQFMEVTNFSSGVGTIFIPSGMIPAGTTVNYYALVTAEAVPVHETVDYFTLNFGNNGGNNYGFTVSAVTGINEAQTDYRVLRSNGNITVQNLKDVQTVNLISMDGRLVATQSTNGRTTMDMSTSELAPGIYVLDLRGADFRKSMKLSIN
ncbi:MAG: T9SS type A sorting domain-containing protein [Flavobacteriales bacterium]|nr:T9SS type A sorting domain-containing protein [Flavobacteriales bacterium]